MRRLVLGACFILELTYQPLRLFAIDEPQIIRLNKFDEHLFGANRGGELLIWSDKDEKWQEIGGSRGNESRILGPLWLPDRKLVMFGRAGFHPFLGMLNDGARIQSLDLRVSNEQDDPALREFVHSPLWSEKRLESLPELPSGTRRLKTIGNQTIAVAETGIFLYDVGAAKTSTQDSKLFGIFSVPALPAKSIAPKLTSEDILFQPPVDFCSVPESQSLLVITKSQLKRFRWSTDDAGGQRLLLEDTLEVGMPDDAVSLIVASKKHCLIVSNKNKAVRVDLDNWTVHDLDMPELKDLRFKELYATDDGEFVMLTRDGDVYRFRSRLKS